MSRNDNVFFLFESNIKEEFIKRKKRQSKKMLHRLDVKRRLDNYFDNKRINRRLGFLEDDDELMWEL